MNNLLIKAKDRERKIIVVTDNVGYFVQIERILDGVLSVIQRSRIDDALSNISENIYDIVIINCSADVLLKHDNIIDKMQEYVPYYPSIIVLLKDSTDVEHINSILRLKDVVRCLSLDFKTNNTDANLLLNAINISFARFQNNIENDKYSYYSLNQRTICPPFPAVCIAISTGGPKTIQEVISRIPTDFEPPIFMIQHGPNWVMEDYVEKFKEAYNLNAVIPKDGSIIKPNTIYIAPSDLNMTINKKYNTIELLDSEKECFVKPSADPLFRSIARIFGQYSVGVVMTGMGKDGSKGALHIEMAGGYLIVENPKTAIARSMPQSVIDIAKNYIVLPANLIANTIISTTNKLYKLLKL